MDSRPPFLKPSYHDSLKVGSSTLFFPRMTANSFTISKMPACLEYPYPIFDMYDRWLTTGIKASSSLVKIGFGPDRQTGRQADRQEGRQADRQAGRQTGRQAGRPAGRPKAKNNMPMIIRPGGITILRDMNYKTWNHFEINIPCDQLHGDF
ncbi:hypothetical protein DPMN_143071 [Dreissena polymorpha]|uniref:Uncharacterized protein n=1 Tax=Dreissena polymorpha TaxID=45954 RepID=A0A9D4GCX8_DREPO|nr:hypothetical protein DPMN_143071 [Dreissena polymorpha]